MKTRYTNPIYFFDPGNKEYQLSRRNWISLGDNENIPIPLELAAKEGEALPLSENFALLIHKSRLNYPETSIPVWAKAHPKAVFIVISGASQKAPTNPPVNVFYYCSPVGKDLSLDGFGQKFCTWYRAWTTNPSCGWGPLNIDAGPLLAFRLLCDVTNEVEKANLERKASNKPIENTADLSGITIHAPKGLGQWLDPFGKKPGDRNAIEEVAGMSGSGEIKKKVKAVLDAVNGSGKLDEAIDDFLKEVAIPNV